MVNETDYEDGKLGAIRNPDGIWINSQVFREEALNFKKKGYYIRDPWDSPAWFDYWTEQRRRCIEGYEVGGVKITGEHYFYLNFLQIKITEDPNNPKSRKIVTFPDFWDGDFNYFWIREIAKEGVLYTLAGEKERSRILELSDIEQVPELVNLYNGLNLEVKIPSHNLVKDHNGDNFVKHNLKGGFNIIVGKSRRKGYSYKSAAIAACNYFTKPDSLTIFGAYEKKFLYPKKGALFTMVRDNISFVNGNTGWVMPSDFVNKQDQIRASYKETRNGVELERGFKSEVVALTFKDNADAARGADAEDIFFEEAGAFGTPGLLKDSYKASQDCVMDGVVKTGMITIFGTSGDMEGGTADYADMFERPEAFDLLPFNNIWDEDSEQQKVGFFHPINWNLPGFYDEQGNSDYEQAKRVELNERAILINNGATSSEIAARLQEKPLGPAEAYASISTNNFPVREMKQQVQKIKANDWQKTKGIPVELSYKEGRVVADPVLNGKIEPITSLNNLPKDKRGCFVVYEQPVPNAPRGLYKIGYDPVRQDEGTSFAGIIVYKGVHIGTQYHSIPVAEYVGRLESADDIDRLSCIIADYYNTQVMHENEVTGVKNWYRRAKRLDALAHQPDAVISKNIKKSKVARVYGCHMSPQLKDAGERYVKEWLLTILDYDEHGSPVRVIDRIYSIRLLQELINYNRKGNFDLVSALFMCMFQVQEEAIGKKYEKGSNNKNAEKLVAMMEKMYKKNN